MIYMLIKSLRIYALPSIIIQNYMVLYWVFTEYLSLTTCVDSLELATASQLAPYCPSLQKPPGSNVGHLAPRNRKGGNGDESARQIGCKERWWYMVMNGVTVWSTYNYIMLYTRAWSSYNYKEKSLKTGKARWVSDEPWKKTTYSFNLFRDYWPLKILMTAARRANRSQLSALRTLRALCPTMSSPCAIDPRQG